MIDTSVEIPLLTFNSLYNLLRGEKSSKKLQKLPDLFYESLKNYMKTKKDEILKLKKEKNILKLKKEKQIMRNSEKIVKELINLRCIKIANIAIKNKLFEKDTLSSDGILQPEIDCLRSFEKGVNLLYKKTI